MAKITLEVGITIDRMTYNNRNKFRYIKGHLRSNDYVSPVNG